VHGEALEGVGYREGANLFGAPYDFRYAPAAPGVASAAFSAFRSSLTRLVEGASARNGNRPAILVTHSFGGLYATEFLSRAPLPWRRRHVKHRVMLGLGVGGSPLILQVLAAAAAPNPPPATLRGTVLAFGNRSFGSTFSLLPSPKVYGAAPLVVTRARNYSAGDIPEFLAAAGFFDDEVARYRTRALPVTLNFRVRLVPMTSVNGVGVPTVDKVVYWDGNFTEMPRVVNGDGDGIVNLEQVLALQRFVGDDPDQPYFKSVLIPNMTHNGLVSDELGLRSVVNEIMEANRATSF
jgi:lysophospholipase-3